MSLNATIVPIPALVPLSPLTDAADRLLYRSEGSTFAIVLKPAYVEVATAKKNAIK